MPSPKVSTKPPFKKGTIFDEAKLQRAKTELCLHFLKDGDCPFGEHCTYAHGEEELQMTKLMDMYRAGLIENVESYRAKLCWTWVSTGSW